MGSWDMFDAIMERTKKKEEDDVHNGIETRAYIVESGSQLRKPVERSLLRSDRSRFMRGGYVGKS